MGTAGHMGAAGHVVVVAGRHRQFADLVRALTADGALVAYVTADGFIDEAAASVRSDPSDPSVWDRIAPHVEQRLGPVDVVVADAGTAAVLETVFRADLVRRGHGDIVVAAADATLEDLVSQVVGTL